MSFAATGSTFVAGDQAAAEWTAIGTYTGQIPGTPPGAGQTVTFRSASILELEGNKVRTEREYYDAASLLAQLEALPAPGTPMP
jgi:predicted ester cyclase